VSIAFGWAFVGILALQVLVNVIVAMRENVKNLKEWCRKKFKVKNNKVTDANDD